MQRLGLIGSVALSAAMIATGTTGASAQVELDGRWWEIAPAPVGYANAIAEWTGEEMLVVPTQSREHMLTFDPLVSRWRTLTRVPRRLEPDTPAVWMGRELLLLTNQVGDQLPLKVHGTRGRWREIRPYPDPIRRIAAAVWAGDRVVAASQDDGLVAEYHPHNDSWKKLPPLPDAEVVRALHWTGTQVLAELNDPTYDSGYAVAALDLDAEAWTEPVEGPVPSGEASSGIWVDDRLFYAWERDELASGVGTDIATFDPATGTWEHDENLCGLTTLRPSWTIAAGTLVVDLDNLRAYDPSTKVCYELPPAPRRLHTHNTLVWTGRDILDWSGQSGFEKPIARGGAGYRMPTWALDPAPGDVLALRQTASTVQNGVRLTMTLDRSPLIAGKPAWVTTEVKNVGKNDFWWWHDGCSLATGVWARMDGVEWRPGKPVGPRNPTGLKWRATEWWNGGGPSIGLNFEPERYVGGGEIACADIGIRDRIKPGQVITERHRWDGTAWLNLGLPPDGRATVTGRFGSFKRVGQKGRPDQTIEVTLDTLVVNGRDEDMLHPMEVVDAALEDPGFAAFIEPIEIGHASDHLIWYDPDMDLWEVGIFDYRSERFKVGLVDPRTGEVLDIIERPWREGKEPYP